MHPNSKLVVRLSSALTLLWAASSYAFENKCTHPTMAVRGRELLSRSEAGQYAELFAYQATIADGADKEDEIPLKIPGVPPVFDHFYQPHTQQPLTVPGLGLAMRYSFDTARARAGKHWDNALALYKQGKRGEAHFLLGRSLHLMQDMHQPGHTHNDPHVPPGSVPILLNIRGLNGHDSSPLEHTVENDCKQTAGASIAAGSVVGAPVSGNLGGPDGFLVSSALEAYASVNFPGQLGLFVPNAIGSINILGKIYNAAFEGGFSTGTFSQLSNKCLTKPHWILTDPLANPLDLSSPRLCLVPNPKNPYDSYDGKLFDGFDNDWWAIAPGRFYIEQYGKVETGVGDLLNDALADSRVARAVEMSAGYLKLFADTVDGVAPQAALKKANGDALARNGVSYISDSRSFRVDAEDLGKTGFPVSGIYRIGVTRSGDPTPVSEQFFGGVATPMTAAFTLVEDGAYVVRVHDGLGKFAELAIVIILSASSAT